MIKAARAVAGTGDSGEGGLHLEESFFLSLGRVIRLRRMGWNEGHFYLPILSRGQWQRSWLVLGFSCLPLEEL